ncbi:photosystem II reaction center protein Ycf12/Psb30 [Laspinema olomoucense]|uniref:photosystem II reaction center protein Ycf12/Psb30 n=1 Tax=Laspinema olomoucense TaxID=3231600 RepID=UPI003F49115B
MVLDIYSGQAPLGGEMDFLSNFASNLNLEVILQLTFVGLILIAGPVVIFLLAFRGGDM